jgi:hypothetical protein
MNEHDRKPILVGGGFPVALGGCACGDPGCDTAKSCRNFRRGDKGIKPAQERARRRMAKQ